MSGWTEEEQVLLVALAAEPRSASAIGRAMGKTRNAVIGRARRTGVALAEPHRNSGRFSRGQKRKTRNDGFRIAAVAATLLGETCTAAAARLGCAVCSINNWRATPPIRLAAEALSARVLTARADRAARRYVPPRLISTAPARNPAVSRWADPLPPALRQKVEGISNWGAL